MTPDKVCGNRIFDDSGDRSAVFSFDPETIPKRCVSHIVPLYIAQAGMEIAGTNTVLLIHFPEFAVSEKYGSGMFRGGFKNRSRELVQFSLKNYLVDTASTLFAHADAAHK